MQTRITSCRSMLSSFDSSSGVRWFGMPLPPCCGLGSIRTRKNPTACGHDRACVRRICHAGLRHPALREQSSLGILMRSEDVRNDLPSFEERFADLRDVRLRYYVGGEGAPLVLVHGLGGAASNWVGVAPHLAEHFRVLVPDLPGHAGSSPLPAAATLDPYAERVHELLAQEGMLP